MAYDPRKWAGGLALAGLAWIVGAWWETPRVEADLAQRGAQALGAKWLDKPDVTVAGRDVSLSGAAFTALSAETAADAVQSVWGVRLVNDDATTLIPPASPYVWSAKREGAELSLAGDAPDPDARAAILAAAKAIEGAEVADRMTYARGRSAGLTAGAAFALHELALMSTGAADLADGALTLSGAAADSDAYLRAVAALATPPDGVTLADADIVPPLAKPFVFSAASGQGKLEPDGRSALDRRARRDRGRRRGGVPRRQDRRRPFDRLRRARRRFRRRRQVRADATGGARERQSRAERFRLLARGRRGERRRRRCG